MDRPLSQEAKEFRPGVYKHYKGDLFFAFFVGRLSEERDQEMVVYKSFTKGYIWIRPLAMFLENVDRKKSKHMDKARIDREKNICKELYHENKGGCHWGKCKDCGVIPFLHKIETGEVLENEEAIQDLKSSVFQDDKYL